MELPLARQALSRAQRMLDDLNRHVGDEVAFRDRLPGVLDLLAGVTRRTGSESKGHRASQFGSWRKATDRTARDAIQELRNAELKRAGSRAKQEALAEMRGYQPWPGALMPPVAGMPSARP
ncbi:MAG: hypothetical protein JWM19_3733 [Actinomycetia bacterium]|nr:hypothetical protein [Actinomycetes bacterium]